jgi:beta-galactosidase
VFGSETASTVSTRGIYANDTRRGYVSAYDVNAPPWGATAEAGWKPIAERPFMAGGFVWTGFDYKGEPTPYGWPCINSHFGIMDMCGFPKDNWYYYKAWWGDTPSIHILPHWNWPGKEGLPIAVWVHSNADRVELFLNGQSLGSKEMPRFGHLEWQVNYAPGTLVAKGYRGSSEVITDRVETTGAPAALRLKTERVRLTADGEDAAAVAVEIVDSQGRVAPVADNLVRFTLTGAGHIAGVGNGDPSSHEPDRASQRRAFNGRCMVIVQANEMPGPMVLRATSPGLKQATVTLNSAAGNPSGALH